MIKGLLQKYGGRVVLVSFFGGQSYWVPDHIGLRLPLDWGAWIEGKFEFVAEAELSQDPRDQVPLSLQSKLKGVIDYHTLTYKTTAFPATGARYLLPLALNEIPLNPHGVTPFTYLPDHGRSVEPLDRSTLDFATIEKTVGFLELHDLINIILVDEWGQKYYVAPDTITGSLDWVRWVNQEVDFKAIAQVVEDNSSAPLSVQWQVTGVVVPDTLSVKTMVIKAVESQEVDPDSKEAEPLENPWVKFAKGLAAKVAGSPVEEPSSLTPAEEKPEPSAPVAEIPSASQVQPSPASLPSPVEPAIPFVEAKPQNSPEAIEPPDNVSPLEPSSPTVSEAPLDSVPQDLPAPTSVNVAPITPPDPPVETVTTSPASPVGSTPKPSRADSKSKAAVPQPGVLTPQVEEPVAADPSVSVPLGEGIVTDADSRMLSAPIGWRNSYDEKPPKGNPVDWDTAFSELDPRIEVETFFEDNPDYSGAAAAIGNPIENWANVMDLKIKTRLEEHNAQLQTQLQPILNAVADTRYGIDGTFRYVMSRDRSIVNRRTRIFAVWGICAMIFYVQIAVPTINSIKGMVQEGHDQVGDLLNVPRAQMGDIFAGTPVDANGITFKTAKGLCEVTDIIRYRPELGRNHNGIDVACNFAETNSKGESHDGSMKIYAPVDGTLKQFYDKECNDPKNCAGGGLVARITFKRDGTDYMVQIMHNWEITAPDGEIKAGTQIGIGGAPQGTKEAGGITGSHAHLELVSLSSGDPEGDRKYLVPMDTLIRNALGSKLISDVCDPIKQMCPDAVPSPSPTPQESPVANPSPNVPPTPQESPVPSPTPTQTPTENSQSTTNPPTELGKDASRSKSPIAEPPSTIQGITVSPTF